MYFLRKLLYLLNRKQKNQLSILLILMIIGLFFEMLGIGIIIPVIAIIIDDEIIDKFPVLEIFDQFDHETFIVIALCSLIIVYLIKTLYLMFLTWKQSRVSSYLSAYLAKKLFSGYLNLPYIFHTQRNSADLIRNIQSEVNFFNNIAQSFITFITEISGIIGISLLLLIVEPLGSLIVSTILFLFAGIFYKAIKNKLLIWGQQRQNEEGKLMKSLNEGFGSIKISKLMEKTNFFSNLFSKASDEKANTYSKIFAFQQFPRLYIEFMGVISVVFFIVVMVFMSKPVESLLPVIGVFLAAAFRLMPSVNRILGSLQNIRSAKPVIDLLYDEFILIEKNKLNSKIPDPSKEILFQNKITISSLSYRYPDTPKDVLKNISFEIKKGECIGLIGESGSGKSTFVDLLVGLLQPSAGSINVDNINIEKNLFDWKKKIGYVSQSIYLTDDTIRNNIAFGVPEDQIDDLAVIKALNLAQLNNHIEKLDDGIFTKVGEKGIKLSGGQIQRIGIARALYNDPDILVLDEATSSLDDKTESQVMNSVNMLKDLKTIIIIAHRLSTIKNCDRVFRIEKNTLKIV
tara:strand:- start:20445 stop:22160 length:1716 start_codon:yes stop_codon:yes gene_type:complete